MALGRLALALLVPYSYLLRIKCVASASIDALATHWPKRNPGQNQNKRRANQKEKDVF